MKYELKISQAAELLGVSESRVSQLISKGLLDSVTINGRRRISRESVEHYRDHVRRLGRPPKPKEHVRHYTLMCADYEVAKVSHDATSDYPLAMTEVLDAARVPWGTATRGGYGKRREFNAWWRGRAIPDSRPGVQGVLSRLGIADSADIPFANLGLSLSDCYWLRPEGASALPLWDEINYFQNDFAARENEGDFWLSDIGLDSPDNTSEGALPKRWVIRDGRRVLLKGCGSDDQRPVNEVVATALHRRLLPPGDYVPYQLVETAEGPACACANFLGQREEFIPAWYVRETIGNVAGKSPYDRFCRHVGKLGVDEGLFRRQMAKMIVCDMLLANSDRHWRNFGFVRNIDTLEMRSAPLFDSGNCLWFDKSAREVEQGDWGYLSKPFNHDPVGQLALVEDAGWFDPRALVGFVEEAVDILGASRYATQDGRLDYIAQGLHRQVEQVSFAMRLQASRP